MKFNDGYVRFSEDPVHCRSVLRGRDGHAIADPAGPSSSSEGGSGSMPGSAPESLSGSEGMAPIKTVSTALKMASPATPGLCRINYAALCAACHSSGRTPVPV